MQLYPHWLDGEFVRIASGATGPKQDVSGLIRALKLHALLGTQFVLNDIQIFDSAAILELFADPEFREFIHGDRNFLDLRVDPDPELGMSPFAMAGRGLTRSRTDGWKSSLFADEDATPIKVLADEIINAIQIDDHIDPDVSSAAVRKYPTYARQLNAVRHAVYYFGMHDKPKKLQALTGQRLSYYQILHQSLEAHGKRTEEANLLFDLPADLRHLLLAQAHEDMTNVEETIKFIDRAIEDPGKRNARSQVLSLKHLAEDSKQWDRIWNNVVQAWNYATEQTLRPDGGSVGTLLGAVSPAPYMESATDILVPVDFNSLTKPIAGVPSLPKLPLDLDGISWKEIAKVRSCTTQTMEKMTRVRSEYPGNIEAISEVLRKHIEAIGKILKPPKKSPTVPYLLMASGGTGTTVIGVFGGLEISSYINPFTIAGGASGLSFAVANQLFKDSEPWRQRNALTSTLFRAAIGQSK